jgi:hypothetical protein
MMLKLFKILQFFKGFTMNFRNLLLVIFTASFMAACAHKGEHKHAASCCSGKQECPMDKKDCDHCKEKEGEHKH